MDSGTPTRKSVGAKQFHSQFIVLETSIGTVMRVGVITVGTLAARELRWEVS